MPFAGVVTAQALGEFSRADRLMRNTGRYHILERNDDRHHNLASVFGFGPTAEIQAETAYTLRQYVAFRPF